MHLTLNQKHVYLELNKFMFYMNILHWQDVYECTFFDSECLLYIKTVNMWLSVP